MFTDEIRADLGGEVVMDDDIIAEAVNEIVDECYRDLTSKERTGVLLHRSGVHDDDLVNDMDAFDLMGVGAMDTETGGRVFAGVN